MKLVLNFTLHEGKCISDCTCTTVYVCFLSFKLQAVIAGRQGDLQRSQKLTKIADTCQAVGLIVAVPYFMVVVLGAMASALVGFFALLYCCA